MDARSVKTAEDARQIVEKRLDMSKWVSLTSMDLRGNHGQGQVLLSPRKGFGFAMGAWLGLQRPAV